jgi:effector-binding domain-containing protein
MEALAIGEIEHVLGEQLGAVRAPTAGTVVWVVAALSRCEHAVPGVTQRAADLVPDARLLREPVQQHDRVCHPRILVEITIRAVQSSPTAVVRGPLDLSMIMPSYDAVYGWLRAQSDIRQVGQNVALYEHGEEMEVGIEVDGTFDPAGDVVSSELPAGRIACATHTTGYGDLQVTYDAIAAWCRDNGHATTGVVWEIYGDPDERDHVDVQICYLLG